MASAEATFISTISIIRQPGHHQLPMQPASNFRLFFCFCFCSVNRQLPGEGDTQESSLDVANADDADGDSRRGRNAAVPITIPVPEGSMPSKVWDRLRKGGSLLGDPEERMMAEGQDGNTPGSGTVKASLRRRWLLVVGSVAVFVFVKVSNRFYILGSSAWRCVPINRDLRRVFFWGMVALCQKKFLGDDLSGPPSGPVTVVASG